MLALARVSEPPLRGLRDTGPSAGYSATTSYAKEWTYNGQSFPKRFWRRQLHAMAEAFTAAGFRLSVISEPQPDPAARELFPDGFHALSAKISFLYFVLEVSQSPAGSDDWASKTAWLLHRGEQFDPLQGQWAGTSPVPPGPPRLARGWRKTH